MSLSPIGLPSEVKLGSLDYSLPPDAKSFSVKVQPSNISSVTSGSLQTGNLVASNTGNCAVELAFPVQNIIFDVPTSSPSTFIDTRLSTLNFRMQVDLTTAPSTAIPNVQLRSNCNSFFDRHYTIGPNGLILEDVNEYSLVADTLINLQMSNSDRDGCGLMYGFDTTTAIVSQGTEIAILKGTTTGSESRAFSVPLLNSLVGVTAEKFFNIGRCPKLQLCFQTTGVLPFTIDNNGGTALTGTGAIFKVTLSDFVLNLEYVDIGMQSLSLLDQTLINNKSYLKGTTYRTSSTTLPASNTGSISLLAGVRGSSIKSLFARFYENKVTNNTGAINGKFDSKNPLISSFCFNIAGIRYPQIPLNPMLAPAQCFSDLQKAMGQFNSSQFNSSIPPERYCILSQGGTASSATTTPIQDWNYRYVTSSSTSQSSFILAQNTEIIAKRGLMSGVNASQAPIFLELNIASAPTNSHNVYIHAMLDCVYIHDVVTGEISVRS